MAFTSKFRGGAAFGNAVFTGRAIFSGGIVRPTKRVTANYTVQTSDDTIIVGSNSKTVTLPAASAVPNGARFTVINDNFTGTTVATAGGNINGAATDTTSGSLAFGKATYVSDGTNYFIA